jgi:hypothetical protein
MGLYFLIASLSLSIFTIAHARSSSLQIAFNEARLGFINLEISNQHFLTDSERGELKQLFTLSYNRHQALILRLQDINIRLASLVHTSENSLMLESLVMAGDELNSATEVLATSKTMFEGLFLKDDPIKEFELIESVLEVGVHKRAINVHEKLRILANDIAYE